MKPATRKDFIKNYLPFVNEAIKGSGIFAGTLFSQAILESSSNPTHLVGSSKLSREANNFFGIKASKSWKGKTYNISTREVSPAGQSYFIKGDFRKYDSVEASIKDYVHFLLNNKRYKTAGVFVAKNVKEQAEALKRAGYATAPNYADIVNSVYRGISKFMNETIITTKSKSTTSVLLFIGLLVVYKSFYK